VAANPNDVLHFWRQAGPAKWYKASSAFDDAIRLKFEPVHHAASRGQAREGREENRREEKGGEEIHAEEKESLASRRRAIDARDETPRLRVPQVQPLGRVFFEQHAHLRFRGHVVAPRELTDA